MTNPFEKRATEYFRDDEAFLAVVTPEPLATFFQEPARQDCLFDRLAMIIGTPGSGKTTLARLFQFTTLTTLLRNQANYKSLLDTLTACRAINDGQPTLIGGRLPLETEYREFWELPYPEEFKMGLMITLLQARTMLTWLRNLQATDVLLNQIEIVARDDANAALATIGGTLGPDLLEHAQKIESSIYNISAALLPPDIKNIDQQATSAYRPFDVIKSFRIANSEHVLEYRPLVMFDDAHSLHPDQFGFLRRWLTRRELKVSRWILTRLDMLTPTEVLSSQQEDTGNSGLNHSREITVIKMQGSEEDRVKKRRAFRKMAKSMAGRYLRQMEIFNRRGLYNLGDLLSSTPEPISSKRCEKLKKDVDDRQLRYGVSAKRRRDLEKMVVEHLTSSEEGLEEDLKLSVLLVLLERYAKRTPQCDLFAESTDNTEPSRPLKVTPGAIDGARIHLLHKYDRPYFFGIDTLCDAGSENAEQFLQLAARIVSRLETLLIQRDQNTMLTSKDQHKLLQEYAFEMMQKWDFPECRLVRRLADGVAVECVAKSLERNAPLNGGANAFGIPQEEFNTIPRTNPELARVLQFGIAYNVFVLVSGYKAKNRLWCLIELGGILLLRHGLTLKRGGFLERRTGDLVHLLNTEVQRG